MKKVSLVLALIILNITSAFSQENRISILSGVGYYVDTFGWADGLTFWLEGGCKIKTGFSLNFRLSTANLTWEITEGPFSGYETVAIRQACDLTFSRPIKILGDHFVIPGFGIKLKRELHYMPDFYFDNSSGTEILYTSYNKVFYELGFTFYIDYLYKFPNGVCLGLRTDTNVIWAVGMEGLTISPLFGFEF